MKLDQLQKLSHQELLKHPVLESYYQLLSNQIRTLPKGTWQKDEDVIVLIRYVLEIKLGLTKLGCQAPSNNIRSKSNERIT